MSALFSMKDTKVLRTQTTPAGHTSAKGSAQSGPTLEKPKARGVARRAVLENKCEGSSDTRWPLLQEIDRSLAFNDEIDTVEEKGCEVLAG